MIDYSKHRIAIERMYEDTATISRYVDVEDPIKHTTDKVPQPIYTDQPCKLSQTGLPRNGQTEDANNINYDAKLFIAPELDIDQGDRIAITRAATGRTAIYSAGAPFPPYSSHQEVMLTFKDWA